MPDMMPRRLAPRARAPQAALRAAPLCLLTLIFAALVSLSLAACDEEAGTTTEDRLAVTLFSPTEVGLPTTSSRIGALRISVLDRNQGEVVASEVIAVQDRHGVGRALDLPFGENLQLFVEALDSGDRTIAYGGSPVFDVLEGEAERPQFVLFISENGSVSKLSAVFSGNQVLPSQFVVESGRAGHTATPLDDGRVLLVGGAVLTAPGAGIGGSRYESLQSVIEVFEPRSGYFDPALATQGQPLTLLTPRVGHEALRLPDGRVLIVGGLTANEAGDIVSTDSVELITPQPDGTFAIGEATRLNTPRAGAASVVRDNGNVIVTGGYNRTPGGSELVLDTVELFDINAGVFVTVPGTMGSPRRHHTATIVGNVVFLAGGSDGTQALDQVEIFSPATQSFEALPSMSEARHSHSALRLSRDDGRYVLVAGGHPGAGMADVPLFTFEIFDTQSAAWVTPSETIGLVDPRASFDMLELRDGTVLVIGGLGLAEGSSSELASIDSVEILAPAGDGQGLLYEAFRTDDPLQIGRFDTASALLDNGMVIITGGARFESGGYASFQLSDIYNPGPPPLLAR